MHTILTGTLVGLLDESWAANEKRSGGRRLTLYVQCDSHGLAAPTEILMENEHTGSCAGLKWGDNISVKVAVKTFQDSRALNIRSLENVVKVAKAAAA